MDGARIGIWTFQFDRQPIQAVIHAAREVERLGFGCLWIPEQQGREAMSLATLLLSETEHLQIANGIARTSARDARSTAAAHRTLTERFPRRYVLGLGGANRLATGVSAVDAMRAYLEEMTQAPYVCPPPPEPPRLVLAAINPRMLALAAERALGAHTYLCPPRHTQQAREIMGQSAYLAPEQLVVLHPRPEVARSVARRHLTFYLSLPAYRRNFLRLGFEQSDLLAGGSDRLIDTVVAHGSPEAVRQHAQAHLDAGADHVCLQVLDEDPTIIPLRQWKTLAAVLLEEGGSSSSLI